MDESTKDSIIRETFKIEGNYDSRERIIQDIKDTGFEPGKNPVTESLCSKLTHIFGFKK